MHSIFYPDLILESKNLQITDKKECHHAFRVLRLKKGDAVGLLNGSGLLAQAEITSIKKDLLEVSILKIEENKYLVPEVHLYCAVPKRNKWDSLLEKCVEIGITSITPLITQNSDVIWKTEEWKKKSIRQKAILTSSAKQCGTFFLPELKAPITFVQYLESFQNLNLTIMCGLTAETQKLKDVLMVAKDAATLNILIGPEGDFSSEEYTFAKESNFKIVTLGLQVLRVETAAISAISFIRQFYL